MAVIYNDKSNTLLSGTKGNDSIQNGNYWNNAGYSSTIISDNGNDTIENWGSNVSINCGTGNDYVYIPDEVWFITGMSIEFANNVSIEGGKGDDTLENYGTGTVYIYNNGDGNDLIRALDEDDTLLVASGTWSTKESGSDVVVNVNEGKITLEGSKTLSKVNIVSSAADVHPVTFINNTEANTLITGTSYKDSIYNDKVSSVTINASADNDTIKNSGGSNVSIDGGAGDDVIENWLPTWASGRVDTSFLSCKNVTLNGGSGNDYIRNNVNNVTIIGGSGNDYVLNYSGNTGDVTNLGRKVSINSGDGNDSIRNFGDNVTINAGSGNDSIYNDGGDNVTISGGSGNDEIFNNCYREDDGSIYYYSYGGSNVVFNYKLGDGNDTIWGFKADSILQIGDGTDTYSKATVGDDIIVTVGDGKITLVGAASLSTLNIDGEEQTDSTTLTLTNDDAAKITLPAQIITADATARTKAIKITGNTLDNSILGGTGKDTLYGGAGADSLFGGKGNDKLYGQAGNDYLEGGAGNDLLSGYTGDDTLYGGTGNDTLTGGAGNDLFVYMSGNDIITDYAAGDKISLGANVTSATVDGLNVLLTVGTNTLTVANGKGKELTLIDADGKEYTTTVGGLVLDNTAGATTLAAGVTEADASVRTKAIKITGNALDNTIIGGSGKDILYGANGDDYLAGGKGNDKLYGQNGNDTLWGGAGNDTLAGGAGADVFLYDTGEGNDVISDFDNSDMLLITGAFTASYDASKKSVAFTVGDGSITLKDFTATRFNVNGFKYRISGTKLVK